MNFKDKIFQIKSIKEFNYLALEIFKYQANNNNIYNTFLNKLNIDVATIDTIDKIPFLPIEFFKHHKVITGSNQVQTVFRSSSTGGIQSLHYIKDISLYEKSFFQSFKLFFGKPTDYCILALLPNYIEQGQSSLVYMVNDLMKQSSHPNNGFYLYNLNELSHILQKLEKQKIKTILWGVSYALMEFANQYPQSLNNTIIIETGGMKGRKEEIIRTELHDFLKNRFNVNKIYSEYGMTELLSQAYSTGNENFKFPPWAKIFIRDIYDPLSYLRFGKKGGINIIDLANINSCAFISTMDIGILNENNTFKILGRYDNSEVRGCNLMID